LVYVLSINPNGLLYYLSCNQNNCQKKVIFIIILIKGNWRWL